VGRVVDEEVEGESGEEEEEWVEIAGVGSSDSSCRAITRRTTKQTRMYYKIAKERRNE